MTNFFKTLIFVLFTGTLIAQTTELSGKITTANQNLSLPDVYVYLEGTSFFDITDAEGKFKITNIPNGEYSVKTSSIGHQNISKNILLDSVKNQIEIDLVESFQSLPLVVINSQSGTGGMLGTFELAGSAHFISKKEIQLRNSININDHLAFIPGVQLQEEDGYGLRPNIGLRGTGSERSSKINLMEDGILAAPAPYSAPSAYYFPNVARMEGIEIIKGASQVNHGPYTTGGTLNFISTSIPKKFSGNFNVSAGSFGFRNFNASIGSKIKGFSYLIEGYQQKSDGFKTINDSDSDTGHDKKDWIGKLRWESPESHKIYQRVQFKMGESSEISNETYLGVSLDDYMNSPFNRYAASQKDRMKSEHRQLSVNYLINPMHNVYFQVTGYQNNFHRNWYKLEKVENRSGDKIGIAKILGDSNHFQDEITYLKGGSEFGNNLYVKANNRSYLSRGIQSKLNYLVHSHSFEFGFRVHFDNMDRFQWIDNYSMNNGFMSLEEAGIRGTESNRIESALAYASHFVYNYSSENWILNLGIRNEAINMSRLDYGKENPDRLVHFSDSRENKVNIFIPGISITRKISEYHQIFAGVHKGFSPPGSMPETKPEESINYELGYRIQKNELFGSFVLFRNNYSNLLGSDLSSSGGVGTGDLFNGGNSVAQGIEFAFSYRQQLTNNLYVPLMLQYTLTDSRFKSDFSSDFNPWGDVFVNDHLPYISKNTFSIQSGLNHKLIWANISSNYMSSMLTSAGKDFNKDNTVPSRWIWNTAVSIKLNKYTTFQFSVRNLTNKTFLVANRPAGWRPGAPRQFIFSLQNYF